MLRGPQQFITSPAGVCVEEVVRASVGPWGEHRLPRGGIYSFCITVEQCDVQVKTSCSRGNRIITDSTSHLQWTIQINRLLYCYKYACNSLGPPIVVCIKQTRSQTSLQLL